jgi:hypothetical protein
VGSIRILCGFHPHDTGVTHILLLDDAMILVSHTLHYHYTIITLLYTVATLLSHCCHTVVTLLSHCCHTVVTLLLHWCYTVFALLSHCSNTAVTL